MGIGSTLQELLITRSTNVNELSKKINVSPQTLYSIIRRDNMKVDFDILLRIAEELNVDIEYFYKKCSHSVSNQREFSEKERQIIFSYRNASPEIKKIVDVALGVSDYAEDDCDDKSEVC